MAELKPETHRSERKSSPRQNMSRSLSLPNIRHVFIEDGKGTVPHPNNSPCDLAPSPYEEDSVASFTENPGEHQRKPHLHHEYFGQEESDGDSDDFSINLDDLSEDDREAILSVLEEEYRLYLLEDSCTTFLYGEIPTDCVICRAAFARDERVKQLPCRHCFHAECVDAWLIRRDSCPCCRKSIKEGR